MSDRISAAELHDLIAAGHGPTVLDTRQPKDYDAGHLPGAINSPTGHLGAVLEYIPRDRPVVTYCYMNRPAKASGLCRSERVAGNLARWGYRAQFLEGGFPAWKRAGLPIEKA